MTKTRIVERLENWGRYWRDHHGEFNGRCRSIEHRYLPAPGEGGLLLAEARQERVSIPPDALDADLVNDAWKRCNRRTKTILKWSYCMGRVGWEFVCTRAGIAHDVAAFETAQAKAIREIKGLLDDSRDSVHRARNSSSGAVLRTPVHSETERQRRGLLTSNETHDDID